MITFQKHFSRALPKYLKDNHHNSLHLTQKHAQVLVLSRDLSLPQSLVFLEIRSPKAVRISEQITSLDTSVLISEPNGGYCLFIKTEV